MNIFPFLLQRQADGYQRYYFCFLPFFFRTPKLLAKKVIFCLLISTRSPTLRDSETLFNNVSSISCLKVQIKRINLSKCLILVRFSHPSTTLSQPNQDVIKSKLQQYTYLHKLLTNGTETRFIDVLMPDCSILQLKPVQ